MDGVHQWLRAVQVAMLGPRLNAFHRVPPGSKLSPDDPKQHYSRPHSVGKLEMWIAYIDNSYPRLPCTSTRKECASGGQMGDMLGAIFAQFGLCAVKLDFRSIGDATSVRGGWSCQLPVGS